MRAQSTAQRGLQGHTDQELQQLAARALSDGLLAAASMLQAELCRRAHCHQERELEGQK